VVAFFVRSPMEKIEMSRIRVNLLPLFAGIILAFNVAVSGGAHVYLDGNQKALDDTILGYIDAHLNHAR
jgi:hypothetical protein